MAMNHAEPGEVIDAQPFGQKIIRMKEIRNLQLDQWDRKRFVADLELVSEMIDDRRQSIQLRLSRFSRWRKRTIS